MAEAQRFGNDKARVLDKADLSRKGSVDADIKDLVAFINHQATYYTTSSCSGRIVVYMEVKEERKKKGCKWLLVSHEPVDQPELASCLNPKSLNHHDDSEYTIVKFEAFILHVVCRSLSDAQVMLQAAVSSGFRNSGITYGKKGRILLAVRSTLSLEVPVACGGKLIVSEEYLTHLTDIVAAKMKENGERTDSFYRNLRGALESKTVAGPEEIKHCHRQHSGRVPETRREEEKERARQHSADEEDIELGDLFLN